MIEHTAIHKGPSIGREAAKAMLDSGEVGLSPFKESTILCQVTCHGEKTNLTITFTAAEAFVSGGEKMHVFTPPSQALLENHG